MNILRLHTLLEYLLMEWDDGQQHSVVDGKVPKLEMGSQSFKVGANVTCRPKEGKYHATIVYAGNYV